MSARSAVVSATWWGCLFVSVAFSGLAYAHAPLLLSVADAAHAEQVRSSLLYVTLLVLFSGVNTCWVTVTEVLFPSQSRKVAALLGACAWVVSAPVTLICRSSVDGLWSGFLAGQWVMTPLFFALFHYLSRHAEALQ